MVISARRTNEKLAHPSAFRRMVRIDGPVPVRSKDPSLDDDEARVKSSLSRSSL